MHVEQQLQTLSHLELLAKQVVEGFITGLHKSPFHGFSVEFAEHRIYNTGEPTRHLDWKLFARTDKLFVKRYEEETNLRCQIVIDDSSSMNFPVGEENKLAFSVHAAAALTFLLKKQRDAVGLSVFSDKVELNTQAKSNYAHQRMLFAELEKLEARRDKDEHKRSFTANALHEIAESIHKRSLVIIFSDMLESRSLQGRGGRESDLFSALQHLRHNKHEVILFHVNDKSKEQNFEFENRPYNFIDMETGENVKVHPGTIKDSYVRSMAAYKKELMLHCAQYRIDFVEADIKDGFKQVLMPYLIKRSKMQ